MTQWSNKHHGAWIDELSQDGKDYTTASGTARHKLPASFSQGLACRRPSHWKHVKIPCSGKVANHLLKSLSQRYGVSQSTVLVTAVLLLLGRYHAIEEVGVLVGTAADNANLERPVLTKATSGRQIRVLVADVSGQLVRRTRYDYRSPRAA